MSQDELYMHRCLQLAKLGEGSVAPNPMVGAVLVYNAVIIGEGFHQQYGGPHAEVNCFNNVAASNFHLIKDSTLYVSLEPCSHFGKTPPCADLIIKQQVKKVVVASRDPFAKVDGSGIAKLQAEGVEVIVGILEQEARALNKAFFHFHINHKPYVTLKWAETADGFIAGPELRAVAISNEITNRWVHQMRAFHSGIMVGFNTAANDNPALSTRLWPGLNPLRIVVDKRLELHKESKLLSDGLPTLVLNFVKQGLEGNTEYFLLKEAEPVLEQLMDMLYKKNILALMVEGGTALLQSFINEGHWNEAFQVKNTSMYLQHGIKAPLLQATPVNKFQILADEISHFQRT